MGTFARVVVWPTTNITTPFWLMVVKRLPTISVRIKVKIKVSIMSDVVIYRGLVVVYSLRVQKVPGSKSAQGHKISCYASQCCSLGQ